MFVFSFAAAGPPRASTEMVTPEVHAADDRCVTVRQLLVHAAPFVACRDVAVDTGQAAFPLARDETSVPPGKTRGT